MKAQVIILAGILVLGSACKNKKAETADLQSQSAITKEAQVYIDGLTNNVAKHADSAGLRLQLINALDSINDFKNALIHMDILLKKDSGNYGLWYRKGKLLENSKDTIQAIKAFNSALRIYPSPDGMLSLANLLAETRSKNALPLCQQVLDLRMGREYDAHAHFISGIYFARTANYTKAQIEFDNCINNNFSYIEAYLEKGFIFYDAKKYEEALKIFKMASNINNTYPDAYYWLAKTQEAMHQNAEALKNYQTALMLDKNLKEATEAIQRLEK
jgi:tetratricopeptide (TPR) repeat protein